MARYKVFDSMPESRDEEGPAYEIPSDHGHGSAAVEWAKGYDDDEDIARGNESAIVYVLRVGDPPDAAVRFKVEGSIRITYQARVAR